MLETARIEWIDGQQVVLFPEGFELPFDEAAFRRAGGQIVLEPANAPDRETIKSDVVQDRFYAAKAIVLRIADCADPISGERSVST